MGELDLVYDVCHNIAKLGDPPRSTDAIAPGVRPPQGRHPRVRPPGHADLPTATNTRAVGQPVLVPGRYGPLQFYVLAGTEAAMPPRPSGRVATAQAGKFIRKARRARKPPAGGQIFRRDCKSAACLGAQRPASRTVAEEMPEAYKDVADVVETVHGAGLARRVAKLKPVGVVKG